MKCAFPEREMLPGLIQSLAVVAVLGQFRHSTCILGSLNPEILMLKLLDTDLLILVVPTVLFSQV